LLGVFLGLTVLIGVGVGVLQVGFHVSPGILAPRWEKLAPASGWSRMFSGQAWVRGLVFCLKAALAGAVAFWVVRARTTQLALLPGSTLATTTAQGWALAMRLALAVAAVFLVLGVLDFLYQRWRHTTGLMMSRQELKEELKRDEGDPLLRARIRKLQREAARKRMLQDVPRASVVITNPTHLAIALRYERGVMKAPRVVAKGAGHLAERIVELARRHAVPVLERKPVARALYKAAKVGQEIPAALYYAVAEVLAYVYRLRNAA
jgi:flagellar biosynthetic protein FlhB